MKTMLDYTNKIKPYFQGVAKVEPTTTASVAHSKGERFYLDGTLVEATADIAIGATIAVNTNVKTADDVETQIANEAEVRAALGAHNLLPRFTLAQLKSINNGAAYSWVDNVCTVSGVSFSVDEANQEITLSGASSAYTVFKVYSNIGEWLKSGVDYLLNENGATNSALYIYDRPRSTTVASTTSSGDLPFTLTESSYTGLELQIVVGANKSPSGKVQLMVRLATDSDPTYQPYAKTNRELTTDKADIIPSALNSSAISSLDDIPVNSMGRVYFSATDSPTGAIINMNVLCVGSRDIKTVVCFSGDRLYMKVKGGGSWAPWHSFVSDT